VKLLTNINALIAKDKNMAEPAASNFTVSANGGAGSAGQPAQYMSGGAYGEGQENMELQTAAKMNKSGVDIPVGRGGGASVPQGEDVIRLDAPTRRPNEPVSTGAQFGDGPGNEALQSTMMLAAQNNEDTARLAALLPVYQQIAESPNASNATRNYVRWLQSQVTQAGTEQG
jgi:hypothetical protein